MVQIISPSPQEVGPLFTLDFSSIRLTAAQFEHLCRDNRDLRLELTSNGELIVMPPTGSRTGLRNANLTRQLTTWVEQDGTGVAFDSSAGFTLPDGAILSPDASWVRRDKWDALTEEEREGFAPLCPDFVVEFRSRGNALKPLQEKMQEYIRNGAQLAWLIDPLQRGVYIYRIGEEVELHSDPATVSADPILRECGLHLAELW
jgi:Uma2 family endonuclease